jgi:hypothetical protein
MGSDTPSWSMAAIASCTAAIVLWLPDERYLAVAGSA